MNIVYSLLGSTLDYTGRGRDRWGKWRPSVALAMQPELVFQEYHLLYQKRFFALACQVERDIGSVSPETRVVLEEVDFHDPWDFEEVFARLYDYSRAGDFRPEEHDYYIHITTGTHVAQICLFLLNEAHHLPGRLIQTHPKRDDPAGGYSLIDLDLSRYDLLAQRFEKERRDDVDFLKSGIATRNPGFNRLIDTVERVAIRSREPILLSGPTGAGKSQLARRIYELKKLNRQLAGGFVEVNCATLKGDGAMSALFGHVKGAFTGAVNARAGLLKAADGGILFLDEIGELGLDEQAMLLRAIEEKVFLPLGTDAEESSTFQLISGTNRDLSRRVEEGAFRDDLLARIDLWHFRLPGLAERREDIEPNLDYELEQFLRREGRRVSFNREARKRFLEYALDPGTAWRGNFRELNAMMTRMATLAPAGRIDRATVEEEIARVRAAAAPGGTEVERLLGDDCRDRYDRFELIQLAGVVKICRASRSLSDAGRKLFAVSRREKSSPNDADRLRKYLARFGLDWPGITGG